MAKPLDNYLRTYRKRAGLSQEEVAFLLGCRTGAKVSRYERCARRPGLEAVFACEVLFGVPARELLAGVFQKVENTTLDRARVLAQKLSTQNPDRLRRLPWLRALISAKSEPTDYGLHPSERVSSARS